MIHRQAKRLSCLSFVVWLSIGCLGCACTEEPDSTPPPPEEGGPIRDLTPEELQARQEFEALLEERVATEDFFYHQFHPYMSESFRDRYLQTAPEERILRFGPELLKMQERQLLLEHFRSRLDRADIEAYYRLPNLEACRRFLAERIPPESRP